jgi:hypothetical protein
MKSQPILILRLARPEPPGFTNTVQAWTWKAIALILGLLCWLGVYVWVMG